MSWNEDEMKNRFEEFWMRIGGSMGVANLIFDNLKREYTDCRRHYHTLRHIRTSLQLLDATGIQGQEVVECAIWFHDMIYVPMALDNESRSANLCRKQLDGTGLTKDQKDLVYRMIIATKTHPPAPDLSTKLMLDIDLAILGAPADEYNQYSQNICKEFLGFGVSMQAYAKGRHEFLTIMLNRLYKNNLYSLQYFHERLNDQARINMWRERASLIQQLQ